jgi:ubiquinone/menaquinone biosynthesis C-methylase UbiE
MSARRTTDYDSIAAGYDRRYGLHEYAGVRDYLAHFISTRSPATKILEVGCGTGRWLSMGEAKADSRSKADSSATASAERSFVAGLEPSTKMIARARAALPTAPLIRGRAESLPFADAAFDRVFCVNALHHFSDRAVFLGEAKRVLRPGGGVMTIGKDPHTDGDTWWVYDYFPETIALDRERYARVRTLRGEMALAGFAWAESLEVDHIEAVTPATEAFENGLIDRAYTSQLTLLTFEEYNRGVERIRAANAEAGGELQLVTDFRLYATVGWLA